MSELSEWQLERRHDKLTASDVSAVLGINPFKTPGDVWIEKTRPLKDDRRTTAAMQLGSDLERGLIKFATRQLGIVSGKHNQWRVAPNGVMGATLDFISENGSAPQEIVEAKTSGIYNPRFDASEWGEDGSDKVPFNVFVQAAAQLICVPKASRVHVAALLGGGLGTRLYRIYRSDGDVVGVMEAIEEQALTWWEKHVVQGEQPEGSPAGIDTLKRIERVAGTTCEIDGGLLARYVAAKEQAKAADEAAKRLQCELIQSLGECQRGTTPDGSYFQYREENAGARLDQTALREEHPEIAARFTLPGTRMMPRHKIVAPRPHEQVS
jgi:putative phage-type endonuclease